MDPDVIYKELQFAFENTDCNKILKIIHDENVDINQRDITHDLQTVLMKMCYLRLSKNEMEEIMASVFKKDPDVNAQDSWGRTAIMHACIANNSVVFDCLMDLSVLRLEMLDFDGNSVLIYAVRSDSICMVRKIIEHQAGLGLQNIYNSKGHSPMTMAKKTGKQNIVNLLESVVIESPPTSQRKLKSRQRTLKDTSSLTFEFPNYVERSQNTLSSVSPFKEMKQLYLQDDVKKSNCTSHKATYPDGDEIYNPLLSTSEKLERSKHKNECTSYSAVCNSNIILPSLITKKCENVDFPKNFESKKRRGSISLPDLRNMKGCLVNSGENSTNYCAGYVDQRELDIEDISREQEDEHDNVFTQSFPSARSSKLEGRLGRKLNSLRRCETEKKLRLPDIVPQDDTRSKTTLSRVRKLSNSDDQLQRVLIQQ